MTLPLTPIAPTTLVTVPTTNTPPMIVTPPAGLSTSGGGGRNPPLLRSLAPPTFFSDPKNKKGFYTEKKHFTHSQIFIKSHRSIPVLLINVRFECRVFRLHSRVVIKSYCHQGFIHNLVYARVYANVGLRAEQKN